MSLSGRILYVDAFDSFSNNVVGLLQESLGVEVKILRIDDDAANRDLPSALHDVDALVIGPGPGSPASPKDVGFINSIWTLSDEHVLPVFGICLGFQSLCLRYGYGVTKLPGPRHGVVTRISHSNTDIFAGVGEIWATQYHSLRVEMGEGPALLEPLAWDMSAEDGENGPILSAVKHLEKPFWGCQFHPESICTSESGKRVVVNWWCRAREWLERHRRGRALSGEQGANSTSPSKVRPQQNCVRDVYGNKQYSFQDPNLSLASAVQMTSMSNSPCLHWTQLALDARDLVDLCEAFDWQQGDVVLLDSQNHPTGRHSLIGVVTPGASVRVTYRSHDRTMSFWSDWEDRCTTQVESIEEIWPILQEKLDQQAPKDNAYHLFDEQEPSRDSNYHSSPRDCPFWGGFMGYISYEAGLETINVQPPSSLSPNGDPDVNFTFVFRSIVIDHHESKIYVQSLLADDVEWLSSVHQTIKHMRVSPVQSAYDPYCQPVETSSTSSNSPVDSTLGMPERVRSKSKADIGPDITLQSNLAIANISKPSGESYRAKVIKCQDYLTDGESYELTLTDESKIEMPPGAGIDPWILYKRLRRLNSAPFGTYLRLSDTVVAGSSPERFCSWTREMHCRFCPIKGTVMKSPEMTRQRAFEILTSSKERAENLMIVDLIRHDLSGVIGAQNVSVPQLFAIEEYPTVYHLVSVIEGTVPLPVSSEDGGPEKTPTPRGLDVLAASLPPGSMTGAPKKRSCEILAHIEQRPRGIYSGVIGYLDVGGAGDFSVVIRTATGTLNADAAASDVVSVWRCGAGGAVTVQSTAEGEFAEMETKAQSCLRAFQPMMA